MRLARTLKRFAVKPKQLRIDGRKERGYERIDFDRGSRADSSLAQEPALRPLTVIFKENLVHLPSIEGCNDSFSTVSGAHVRTDQGPAGRLAERREGTEMSTAIDLPEDALDLLYELREDLIRANDVVAIDPARASALLDTLIKELSDRLGLGIASRLGPPSGVAAR
jgi:hypothetical protein